MARRAFDPAMFYAEVKASRKEQSALRQDLVRGVKDYVEARYGYDRYGAETVLLLADHLTHPYIYGFAVRRVLNDRRLTLATKCAVALRAVDVMEYGADLGTPYGLYAALYFLALSSALSTQDLRYALVASTGDVFPFEGVLKQEMIGFLQVLVAWEELTSQERLFWTHSLLARHGEGPAAANLIQTVLHSTHFSIEERTELCRAWVYQRQPRISFEVDTEGTGPRQMFVAQHLPFWKTHLSSWPSAGMVKAGLVWLAGHADTPEALVQEFVPCTTGLSETIYAAVADIVSEHFASMPEAVVRSIIEQGIALPQTSATRRRFYQVGLNAFGPQYLQRASADGASSVRQWATRQQQGETL